MKPDAVVTTLKRTLDITVGLAGTLVFLLAYPILALLIKLESPGPALYLQSRVGLDKRSRREGDARERTSRKTDVGGTVFTITKFRTMRLDAESNGPQLWSKTGDPRVTRLGRILRSTHLDELPQFWNVLKGEMSFIGPRPERPHFTVKYFERIPLYRERTRHLKPGITGLSQITLGYDDSLDSIVRKTQYDLAYRASLLSLRTWLRMEAWCLLNTLLYLLNRRPLAESGIPPSLALPEVRIDEDRAGTAAPALSMLPGIPETQARTAVALVSKRGILTPTLVLTRSHAEANPQSFRPEPLRPESLRKAPVDPASQKDLGEIANFLTVDVECWFHAHNLSVPRTAWDASPTRVVENVSRILGLLASRNAKATFFVLGWVAERHPEVVRMIDAAGHEIGTHGYFHDKVTDLSPYQFEKDLDMSLNVLARLTNQKIAGHRASNFSIVESTLWALEILARYGLEYDSSIFPVARKRYGIGGYPNRMPHTILLRDAAIKEIPLSTLNIGGKALPMSGGGYLRLYPYAFTELFIKRRNMQGLPAMVYFHPWELDADQDRRDAGVLKTFQHYVNLDTTEWKIDRLLERFRFTSVKENLATERIKTMLARNPVQARAIHSPSENPVTAASAAALIAASREARAPGVFAA